MLISAQNSTLVVIDSQMRLVPVIANSEMMMAQCVRLVNIAKIMGIPIVCTEQNPQALGVNFDSVRSFCSHTLVKHHFDACKDGLLERIPNDRKHLILVGCEAHICILQTAFGLLENHIEVTVAVDCIGSRDPIQVDYAVSRMRSYGVNIATVEMITFEWLRSSTNSHLKKVLQYIK
ncbi:isochorismatase family protein [Polynucleobacter sp. UK-Gri1-W3]|uniref:isochorismatase family protein n=1 Tax=Polynucleobacter sp. UK-Gri1-W3 TaxID=1819737 RepID=UPI001C0AC886|nr:isochorismatase family protein [Polynucleobacter sp. UK-Gri1-W3]MBU3538658.1 isochorismatase family protein [Polynucleobacter sp. UK-Gri1-W3]